MKKQRIESSSKIKKTVFKLLGFFIILLLSLSAGNSFGQLYTGGSVSVNYDKGYYVDVAPLLGYKVGIVDFGISPFYSYSHREDQDPKYSFGNRIFTQLTFYKDIFAHAEVQMANVQVKQTDERKWVTSFLLGQESGILLRQKLWLMQWCFMTYCWMKILHQETQL